MAESRAVTAFVWWRKHAMGYFKMRTGTYGCHRQVGWAVSTLSQCVANHSVGLTFTLHNCVQSPTYTDNTVALWLRLRGALCNAKT